MRACVTLMPRVRKARERRVELAGRESADEKEEEGERKIERERDKSTRQDETKNRAEFTRVRACARRTVSMIAGGEEIVGGRGFLFRRFPAIFGEGFTSSLSLALASLASGVIR